MKIYSTYPIRFDACELRSVLGQFTTGVAAVTINGSAAIPLKSCRIQFAPFGATK